MRTLLLLLLSTFLLSAAERKSVFPTDAKPIGPFSPGMWAGDTLYVSGQGARDAAGNLPDGIEAQTRQTMENVKQIVEAGGLTMADVVYTHIYLVNMADEPAMRAAYASYFPGTAPASVTVGTAKMPLTTPVEISAVAVLGKAPRLYLGAQPNGSALTKSLRGSKLDTGNLVAVTVYYTSEGYDDAQREVSALTKPADAPAVQLIQVASLPGNARVSLTGVAATNKGDRKLYRSQGSTLCAAAGETVYCTAQASRGADMPAQVNGALTQIETGLKDLGADLSRAVANNVYLNRIEEFTAMNTVYAERFPSPPPTRTTVQPRDSDDKAPMVRIAVIAVR